MKKLIFSYLLFAVSIISGCGSHEFGGLIEEGNPPPYQNISVTGTVKKNIATNIQYGTHLLVNSTGETLYVLLSASVIFDDYLDKIVIVKGRYAPGYPVVSEFKYIEVQTIDSL